MNWLIISSKLFIVFLFSFVCLLAIRFIAIKVGLVDKPNQRKKHSGAIPLVGGISAYISVCFYFLCIDKLSQPHIVIYLICATILVLIGALDDRFDISVKIRATVQAVVAIIMMCGSGIYLNNLGGFFGIPLLYLGPFGYVLTLFAVWAAINAFNMVDGIDGLLGGLSCVSFGGLGVLLLLHGMTQLAIWCFVVIVALLPYLLLNLEVFGHRYKVFMGDAGSTLIGFTILWVLLQSTQCAVTPIKPVAALWVIAIPLIDMIAIMYRRLSRGKSPFIADRQHIHHLMMRIGFTSHQTFFLITFMAAILIIIGIIIEYVFNFPDWLILALFLLVFFLYGYCIKKAWRMARCLKKHVQKTSSTK